MRLLFVCLGNICRSPAAEVVARKLLPECDIDSAGTGHWHVGEVPYEPMQNAARARGYDMSGLRARQVVPKDFDRFDLIIAMDTRNLEDIAALRPKGNATPVKLFTDYAPETGRDHIPDPYYTRDFDGALTLIENAAKGLAQTIGQQR